MRTRKTVIHLALALGLIAAVSAHAEKIEGPSDDGGGGGGTGGGGTGQPPIACTLACQKAQSASGNADLAKIWADLAASSSDPDCATTYTVDAQYYADVAAFYADYAAQLACEGPGSASLAEVVLLDTKRREMLAQGNAMHSRDSGVDGCSESASTYNFAGFAVAQLTDAANFAADCD